MSQKCQISQKKYNRANKVSFSNKHHRYMQKPNLQFKTLWDPEQKKMVRLRVSTKALKTITKYGLRSAIKRYGASQDLLMA